MVIFNSGFRGHVDVPAKTEDRGTSHFEVAPRGQRPITYICPLKPANPLHQKLDSKIFIMGSKRNRHGSHGSSGGGGRSSSGSNKSKHHHDSANNTSQSSSTSDDDEDSLDFCQRFFGDPLFSNLNVSLLFLFATFVPMIVWIPHFSNEVSK